MNEQEKIRKIIRGMILEIRTVPVNNKKKLNEKNTDDLPKISSYKNLEDRGITQGMIFGYKDEQLKKWNDLFGKLHEKLNLLSPEVKTWFDDEVLDLTEIEGLNDLFKAFLECIKSNFVSKAKKIADRKSNEQEETSTQEKEKTEVKKNIEYTEERKIFDRLQKLSMEIYDFLSDKDIRIGVYPKPLDNKIYNYEGLEILGLPKEFFRYFSYMKPEETKKGDATTSNKTYEYVKKINDILLSLSANWGEFIRKKLTPMDFFKLPNIDDKDKIKQEKAQEGNKHLIEALKNIKNYKFENKTVQEIKEETENNKEDSEKIPWSEDDIRLLSDIKRIINKIVDVWGQ